MSSPQVENGYIRIANELFDAIVEADLSKRQLKVLLAILRKTFGFGKKVDDMTITQLASATGLARPHVSAAVSELERLKVIKKASGRYGYEIGILKNYSEWAVSPYQNGTPVPKRYTPRTKTVHPPYQNGTHKRQLQKTTPKEEVAERFAPATMSFETKTGEPWDLTPSKLAEWTETYPNLDVPAELRKARQWLRDNPTRRKTARGMTKCLGGWLSRAADKAVPSKPNGAIGAAPSHIWDDL